MNLERFIYGFGRRILRRFVDLGIRKGIDRVAGGPPENQTPEDKARARQAKQMTRKARKAARLARKMNRF